MNNIFSSLFRPVKREQTATSADAASADATGKVSGGSFEENVVHVHSQQASLTIGAVYRAVGLRADTIAQMDMQYQRKDSTRNNFVIDMNEGASSYVSYGKRLNWLLRKRPNPLMTATSLFKQMAIDRLMRGNAFLYIERDTLGDPVRFWLARCNGYDPVNGLYVLTYLSDRGLRNVTVGSEDVVHWPNTFRDDYGFWGIPTLHYAFKTLSLIATEQKQNLDTAAKGGRVKLLVGEDTSKSYSPIAAGMFDKKQMEKYAAELSSQIYRQDVTAFRGLDKVQNISMTSADMQMIEQLQMGLDDVARFFSVPRPLLMLDSNSHYTTPTAATQEFLRSIQPDAKELEDEFDTKLLNVFDYSTRRFHFCEKPLFRLDPEAKARVDQLQLQTGTKTVNEIRAENDMPSVEQGDIVYISTNMAELGSQKLNGDTMPAPVNPSQQTTE